MSGAPEVALTVLFSVLAVAVALAFVRVVRGPSLPDRVVALDLIAAVGVAICGLAAVAFERAVFLDVAMLLALISFVGTVAFARYLEWRGR
jgi:multicomponent Na+:H+ antiporter subunit F